MVRYSALIAAIALAAPGCGAPLNSAPEPSDSAYKPVADQPEKSVSNRSTPLNERFRTLDEYLAFLEKGAAIDKPYYREVRPGVYLLVTTIQPPPPPQYFTREELAREFGFAE